MTSTVRLDHLHISERNVSKTDRDLDIDQLADDIDTPKGLLQNLVVVPEGPSAHFGVVAGGRRLLALQRLVERGRLAADWPVPVERRKREDGREISLSENLQRVDMNPADEVEAFAAIVADYEERGETDRQARIARCARHFGETIRHIEQRLRLAALAPDILDGLRTGRISLDAARAYAAYPDQDRQMQVFGQMEGIAFARSSDGRARHSVAAIRAALAGTVYHQRDRHVRYVGVDAYHAAGGRIARELFMGSEDEDVLLDTTLLDRLYLDKAELEAGMLARREGFAGAALVPWHGQQDYPKIMRGYIARHGGAMLLPPEQRADAILICRIAEDGSAIEPNGHSLVPIGGSPAAQTHSAAHSARAAPASSAENADDPPLYTPPPPAPRPHESDIGRIRREEIEARALRLAAPPIAGTALEGRAHWPDRHRGLIEAVQRDEAAGMYAIAIYVTVTADELDHARAAAERGYDAEEAERGANGSEAERAAADLAAPADPDETPAIDPLDREPEWPLRAPTANVTAANVPADVGPVLNEGATRTSIDARELEPAL